MLHKMKIMQPTLGDDLVTWDPANEGSVQKAKEKFDAALKEGKKAYRVERKKTGEPITEFDPSLTEILLAGPLVGG